MYRLLLPIAILSAGFAGAGFQVELTEEEADAAYQNIYRIAERHQGKATLLLIKHKLLCKNPEKKQSRCRKVIKNVQELLMKLNGQLGDQQPNVKTLRDHYCALPISAVDDTPEHKRCRRLTRLQNNLELSPQEQLNKSLKIKPEELEESDPLINRDSADPVR